MSLLRHVTRILARPIAPHQTLISRSASRRDRLYGVEEGHDIKNEVRKDKWIRKRKIRLNGEGWRRERDLPPNSFHSFALSRQPDWSFKDGTPGYLSDLQRESVDYMSDVSGQVHRALQFMRRTSGTSKSGKAEVPKQTEAT